MKKNRLTRLLALMVTLVMALSLLSACGGDDTAKDNDPGGNSNTNTTDRKSVV